MYSKQATNVFGGLNSEVAPSLLKDGEARDILNFRMDELGKLVNRHGYCIGLERDSGYPYLISGYDPSGVTFNKWQVGEGYEEPLPPPQQGPGVWIPFNIFTGVESSAFIDVTSHINNNGIVGLGEYIFANYWDVIDSDRVMVYFVRAGIVTDANSDYSHKGTYLFSPLTGAYANKLLVCTSLDYGVSGFDFNNSGRSGYKCISITDKKDPDVHGVDFKGTEQLYAPNRGLVDTFYYSGNCYFPNNTVLSGVRPSPWIDDYVDMHEYNHKLVISDRTNGDLMMEDEYDREQDDNTYGEVHELRLRDNTLSPFDIDSVEIDLRFDSGCENDKYSGVKTGMGLYGYEFEKKWTNQTVDHFSDTISNMEWLGYIGTGKKEKDVAQKVAQYLDTGNATTYLSQFVLISGAYIDNTGLGTHVYTIEHDVNMKYYHNNDIDYVFSNSLAKEEFDDLQSVPKLRKDEIDDLIYTDSYVWKEYELTYHPTIGIINNDVADVALVDYAADLSNYALNEISRSFDKTNGLKPRITKIKKKGRFGEEVPLGVWRYRFVWDYGGAQYSAPSAEILIPDIMWSATKDVDMISESLYTRPIELGGEFSGEPYFYSQMTEPTGGYTSLPNNAYYNPYPAMYQNNDTELTDYGKKVYDLKQYLYSGMNHRFAPIAAGYDIATAGWTHDDKGEFSTMITGVSTPYVKYHGIFYEGLSIVDDEDKENGLNAQEDSDIWNRGSLVGTDLDIYPALHSLYLPVFKTEGTPVTYNSLCDTDGRIRLAYKNVDRGYYIATNGVNAGFGYNDIVDHHMDNNDMANFDTYAVLGLRYPDLIWGDKYKTQHTDMYFNIQGLSNDNRTDDWNNQEPSIAASWLDTRPNTALRLVKEDSEDYLNTNLSLKTDARNRLIRPGIINITIKPDKIGALSSMQYLASDDVPTFKTLVSGDILEYDSDRSAYTDANVGVQNVQYNTWTTVELSLGNWSVTRNDRISALGTPALLGDNLTLENYFQGTRLMLPEQLTAIFPSSVLFNSPRIGFKIPSAVVPRRAKKLMIYRTLSTHDNDYMPTSYGLVDIVSVERTSGAAMTKMEDKSTYSGVYYFDKIKDDELDYSSSIEENDGMTRHIKSRFNMPLNERFYYANFEETFAMKDIRKHEYESGISGHGKFMLPDVHHKAMMCSGLDESGFSGNTYLKYRYMYINKDNVYSDYKQTDWIQTSGDNMPYNVDKYANVLYFLPSKYNDTIKSTEIYRTNPSGVKHSDTNYYYVGKVEADDDGIFVDNGITGTLLMPTVQAETHNYESAIRVSEPYKPDKIKQSSFIQVRAGDGDQITGLESLYGNLIIFKENSCHRMAVQGQAKPISRTDELSPKIGCIAPLTLKNIDNVLYFLSWEGLMRYDNNKFESVDGAFKAELQARILNAGKERIRDASCAYNPATSELYLNMPIGCNKASQEYITYYDVNKKYKYNEEVLGHVYVVNMLHGYATKYAYTNTATLQSNRFGNFPSIEYLTKASDSQQIIRKYYTNSLGELRSADILPKVYNLGYSGIENAVESYYKTAGMYIETPHESGFLYKGTDTVLHNDRDYGNSGNYDRMVQEAFPHSVEMPIKNIYRSKFYDMNNGTVNKRVRDNNFDIYSEGFIDIITSTTNNYNQSFNKIESGSYTGGSKKESFNPTISYASGTYFAGYSGAGIPYISGTNDNYIRIVNETVRTYDDVNDIYKVDDRAAKGKQYHIDIEAEGYTYLSEYNFYWRMIHSYIR